MLLVRQSGYVIDRFAECFYRFAELEGGKPGCAVHGDDPGTDRGKVFEAAAVHVNDAGRDAVARGKFSDDLPPWFHAGVPWMDLDHKQCGGRCIPRERSDNFAQRFLHPRKS